MVAGILLLCVLAAVLFFIGRKKKNREKEKERYLEMRNRERELDDKLRNRNGSADKDGVIRPYKVTYSEQESGKQKNMVPVYRIIRKTKHAEQLYQFRQDEVVYIGEREGVPELSETDPEGRSFCKIHYKQNEYCVRNLNGRKVTVRRGRERTVPEGNGIVLRHGDIIEIQGEEFLFQCK